MSGISLKRVHCDFLPLTKSLAWLEALQWQTTSSFFLHETDTQIQKKKFQNLPGK